MTKNRLGDEKSPYLLQHKDNPVHWYAWGTDAFTAARAQNKPIFLSIGYSTCYWCHVMEKDSFELQDVAAALNADFISIKVDREEHPDVDALYMDAVVGMTGHGGWPMSVFLTPDLKPFYGGTFFRREEFLQLLANVTNVWKTAPQKVIASGDQIVEQLQKNTVALYPTTLSAALVEKAVAACRQSFDTQHAGFGSAPKFPPAQAILMLLQRHARDKNPDALKMSTDTLNHMARGGIRDQLGGGFHRYSVDAEWLAPHFEKMLYDNALLTLAYCKAQSLTQNVQWAEVIRSTCNYVLREMTAPEGGFFAAQDAGDVGKEGEYYTWTWAMLEKLLTVDELKAVNQTYGAGVMGNFEHGQNILNLSLSVDWNDTHSPHIESAHQKLMQARRDRKAPHQDTKILTAWNGLMIAALATAAQTVNEPRYLEAAEKAAHFVKAHLTAGSKLLRRYCNNDAALNGTAADYAFMIYGLIALYRATQKSDCLDWAVALQTQLDTEFWDSKDDGYFASSAQELIVRQKEFQDGALPSANSISAHNLIQLAMLTGKMDYLNRAEKLLNALAPIMGQYPMAATTAIAALDTWLNRNELMTCDGVTCVQLGERPRA
ncbi:MAG: thioredoxin domain-containing protein [Deltaproteobacteria bacterium CG11_big_fil_rev_8_21_14_0_20_47_16]|nr:MAG: thioredoxin domain-containing protein [Deltaproteobacteria bacterium CG11_big_fil_rev_8_21_14_0_20_47_16]